MKDKVFCACAGIIENRAKELEPHIDVAWRDGCLAEGFFEDPKTQQAA